MNIESTANKFLNPISKHGELVGAGAFMVRPTVFTGFVDSISRITQGNVHMLEVQNYINFLTQSSQSNFVSAVAAAVAGYFIKDAAPGMFGKIGEILQKVGTGYAIGEAAYGALWYSTHSPGANTTGRNTNIPSISQAGNYPY